MKISNIYLLFLVGLVIIACDPLKDVSKEVTDGKAFVDDLVYTLTDDDYDLVDQGFGSFSDIEDVKRDVPVILSNNFPALGKNSSALVSYAFFNGSSPDLRGDNTVTTVTTEQYDQLGFTFGNFSSDYQGDVEEWANTFYPEGQDGDHIDVTFDFYNGSVNTETGRVVYTVAYQWKYSYILPDDAYGDFFGESGIDFSNQDEGKEKMPVYLDYLTANGSDFSSLTTEAGAKIVVQYNYDDRCFGDDCEDPGAPNVPAVALYIYDGLGWVEYGDGYQTTTESLNFGNDGTVWVPDNTVKYTFTSADYTECGKEENGLGNPAARENLRSFGNFGTQWSHEEIIESIDFILKLNFPGSEVGQKYLVTYNTYPAGDLTDLLILDASGDYIELTE